MTHQSFIDVSVKLNTYFLYEVDELFVFTILEEVLNHINKQQQKKPNGIVFVQLKVLFKK